MKVRVRILAAWAVACSCGFAHAQSTTRVSVATGGAQANQASGEPSISADGRYVAFFSYASNLVAGIGNGYGNVYVRDRQLATTERVSESTGGAQAINGSSDLPSISADGRYVAFRSGATNLVAGDTNAVDDIFVRDRQLATTECVSMATGGAQSNGHSGFPSISADGRYVAFWSHASNLVAGDTNGSDDVFVHDRQLGTTERVSVATGGLQSNGVSRSPSISGDGLYVAFLSGATNLVAGDTNARDDIFVRDRQLATTERVSVASGGTQAVAASYHFPSISADGRYVAFPCSASDLVAGDTNASEDHFVHDRIGSGVAYCFGDGSGTSCPCAPPGPEGAGCLNSLGNGGVLSAGGSASLSADTLVLFGSGMPNGSALYFQGTARANGGFGSVFGDGLRCAGGTTIRLAAKANASGASQFPAVGDPAVSVRGAIAAPGTRDYQVWYRNAAAFCQPETFNLTNGWEIEWEL